jgi:probable F420-dependent oxidoreductase
VDFGLILPSYRRGASVEVIDAASETAERLGWHSVFTTDHLLVEPSARSEDYYEIFDAVVTLAHIAARTRRIKVGASVIVVPMRNAIVLAKELATIDALSGGRLIVGAGSGWNKTEFDNVGEGGRFHRRGAYLDEAIAIWRHLWGGGTGPFHGRFHDFEDVRFAPLPAQGANVPIWLGGRDERALSRTGRVADGYHSTTTSPAQYAVRMPLIKAAADEAGREAPLYSARLRVHFGPAETPFYQLAGTPEQMVGEIRSFAEVGVSHIAVDFAETDAARCVALIEKFDGEVVTAFR